MIPTAFKLLHDMPEKVLFTLKHFLSRKNDPDGGSDFLFVSARIGVPVESPASVAYEQCVDLVEHCAKYYNEFPQVVLEIFKLLSKSEPRFRPYGVLKRYILNCLHNDDLSCKVAFRIDSIKLLSMTNFQRAKQAGNRCQICHARRARFPLSLLPFLHHKVM